MDLLNTLKTVWAQYRAFHATLRELSSHSDRELRQLGIARADITRIAFDEAERRFPAAAPRRPDRRPGALVTEGAA